MVIWWPHVQQGNSNLHQNTNDNREEHHVEEIVVCIYRPTSLNRILWVTFIIAILKTEKGDPLRDLLEHLPILLDKVHEDKVILRIISETIMYEFINMNGMVVGTPAVTPQSVISQRGQPCPSLPVSFFMKGETS